VGRSSKQYAPDVGFSNAFVSRKHMIVRREGEQAVLYDLNSRHGTELNGVRIEPNKPYPLKSFDIIKLAKGMAVLHFSYLFADQTLELEPLTHTMQMDALVPPLELDWEKRDVIVEGKRISMSEKEYLLIKTLYDHANKLVTLDEIKQRVWPERTTGVDGAPDVSVDELNALVYRIRKKYGKDTFTISAVRGNGYVLEWNEGQGPANR
jgi:DNA-binding winged helix-turn-helix (wHTH) protein